MKRIISILLIATAMISLLTLTSCSKADIDLTGKENVYKDLSELVLYPEKYVDKTVALTCTYTVVYNFSENKIVRYTMRAFDTTGQKKVLYAINYSGEEFPAVGTEATVMGKLTADRHINVSSFEDYEKSADFQLDTLNMKASELEALINDHREKYSASEHYGKTIRIYGHLAMVENYAHLIGLDSDGKHTWNIVLNSSDASIKYPVASGNTVNPVEIIGKLTTFEYDNVVYPCIEVISVGSVESVFK